MRERDLPGVWLAGDGVQNSPMAEALGGAAGWGTRVIYLLSYTNNKYSLSMVLPVRQCSRSLGHFNKQTKQRFLSWRYLHSSEGRQIVHKYHT